MVLTMLFSGCSTKIGNLGEYIPSTLYKAVNMPSKEELTNTKASKIIIMAIDDNGIRIAQEARLEKTMLVHINEELAENKNVQILKRVSSNNYEQILNKEIKAAELEREIGEDIGAASYLLTGQISNATYNYEFSEGYYYETKEGEKYSPPTIDYEACVKGTLKIFSLPDLNEAHSKGFNGCSSYTEEVRNPTDAKVTDPSLVRKAGIRAMHQVSFSLKNFFTKKGYILEKRKKKDVTIIRVMLGSNQGARSQDRVEIYSVETIMNPLTGQSSKKNVLIGRGTISEKVTSIDAWIVIKELEKGKQVHLGDYIKIKYSQGFWNN